MLGLKTFTWAVLLTLISGLPARAQEASTSTLKAEAPTEASKRRWNGDWKFEISGGGFSEDRDEGAAAAFSFTSKFDYRFNSILSAHFEPEVDLYSGRLQERFDNDAYENRMGLGSGYVGLKPIEQLEARGGIVSQEFLDHPLLISRHRAFPGLQVLAQSNTEPVNVMVVGQQVIPTSYSLNAERTDKEAMPSFQTISLHLSGKRPGLVEWETMAGHYRYSELPNKVSFQSAQTGNTPLDAIGTAAGTRLAYQFNGYFWRAEACLCLDGPLSFDFKYAGILNSAAPSEARDGQIYGVGPRFRIGSDEIKFIYYGYFLESDATVSRYARSSLGFTNRIGDILEAEYHFKDQGFKIKAQYVRADTLAETANQKIMTQYSLGVETDYAPF
ncbi:MAG: hypothetical protein KF799_11140 [Bdellovibrionales bacterium]|nr:hypothetical protein [Bdellovibrionales bacterium]